MTDLLPSEILEARSQRSSNIVILASESVLSAVGEGVEFISPSATEVEPLRRCMRRHIRRTECIVKIVVSVSVRIQEWVPEWTAVCFIMQQTQGQHVRVPTRGGVHGVGTGSGVDDRLKQWR